MRLACTAFFRPTHLAQAIFDPAMKIFSCRVFFEKLNSAWDVLAQ